MSIAAGRSETYASNADVARVEVADDEPDLADKLSPPAAAVPACAAEDTDEDLVVCETRMLARAALKERSTYPGI